MFVRHFGERLEAERTRLGLSQTALAEVCGVGKRSQQNYESDERVPDAAYLAALAEAGGDVLYVLTGSRAPGQLALDAAERVLVDSYRRCNAQAQSNLIQTAALLAAGLPGAAGASTGTSVAGSNNQVNSGAGAVQISGLGNARRTRKS